MKVFGSGEGASLRNHREIVAAAWTDFEARVPDRYPPVLSVFLTFKDGWGPGLKYPNLLHSDSGRLYHTQRRVVSWRYQPLQLQAWCLSYPFSLTTFSTMMSYKVILTFLLIAALSVRLTCAVDNSRITCTPQLSLGCHSPARKVLNIRATPQQSAVTCRTSLHVLCSKQTRSSLVRGMSEEREWT